MSGERRAGACLGGLLFDVGHGCGSGAYGVAVKALEGGEGLGGGFESVGDGAQVVLAVQGDGPSVEVGADGDGGPAVVGMGVDDEPAVADVVVDGLGCVGDLPYLSAGQPVHGVVRPGPFLVDGFT